MMLNRFSLFAFGLFLVLPWASGQQHVGPFTPSMGGWPPTPPIAVWQIDPEQYQQMASCVVQIEFSGTREFFDLSLPAIASTTTFVEPIVKRVIDAPAGAVGKEIVVIASPAGTRLTRIDVMIRKTEKPYAEGSARKILNECIVGMRGAITQSRTALEQAHKERIASATASQEASRKRLEAVRQALAPVKAVVQNSEYVGMDPTQYVQQLRQQRRSQEMQLKSAESRLAQLDAEADPVQAWGAAVKSLEEALAGAEGQDKADGADAAKVAELKAKLADARAQFARSNSSGMRSSASEIRSLQRQSVEARQRIEQIDQQLGKLEAPELADAVVNYRGLLAEEERLRSEIIQQQSVIAAAEKALLDSGRFTLTVIDGTAQ